MEMLKRRKDKKQTELHKKEISTAKFPKIAVEKSREGFLLDPEPLFFLEYSVKQKCFHVDSLDRIISANRDMCRREVASGYVVIAGPFTDYGDAMWAIHDFTHLKITDYFNGKF